MKAMRLLKKYGAYILFLLCLCLWGGFYDFANAILGTVLAGLLLICGKLNEEIKFPIGTIGKCLGLIMLCSIVSVFTARDKGIALIGTVRILTVLEFWIYWNNLADERREQIFQVVPVSGALATMAVLPAFFLPGIQEHFYRAGRLGGVFQYSNTYALFLLAGLIVLVFQKHWEVKEILEAGILLVGIVFTGSRSVFVFTIVALVLIFWCSRELRKKWKWIMPPVIISIILLQMCLHLNIERLVKLSMDSSTLNGRFLYWRDAIPIIVKHPFGLGYMGYYFLQPQFQTGNYVTKYVHNELLQCALDIGILAAILTIVIVISALADKGNKRRNKALLILLGLHSLFDFDLQFSIMLFLMLMCLGTKKEKYFTVRFKWMSLSEILLGMVLLYFSVALGAEYVGDYELALRMYPRNTFARAALMFNDEKQSNEIAKLLIRDNGMLASAYENALGEAASLGQAKEALEYERMMLQCAGYNSYYYNQAVYELSIVIDSVVREGDLEGGQEILEEIQGMSNRIKAMEKRTSGLAYRINDKPGIVLRAEIEAYIQGMERIVLYEK